jgi:hypothetical protein
MPVLYLTNKKAIMKTNKLKTILLAAIGTATFFAACKKNEGSNETTPVTTQVDQLRQVGQTNAAIHGMLGGAVHYQSKSKPGGRETGTTSCPVVAVNFDTSGGFGIRVALDYGTGCPDDIAAGIIRKGKVEYGYFYSNNQVSAISSRYTQYQDAFNTYNGLLQLAYNSIPTGSNWVLSANNFGVQNAGFGSSVYNGSFTHKQTQGAATWLVWADDVYEITGGSNVVNNLSGTGSYTILQPLIQKGNCNYVVQGKAKITLNGLEGILDYGNGNCDNLGTITIGGIVYPVVF